MKTYRMKESVRLFIVFQFVLINFFFKYHTSHFYRCLGNIVQIDLWDFCKWIQCRDFCETLHENIWHSTCNHWGAVERQQRQRRRREAVRRKNKRVQATGFIIWTWNFGSLSFPRISRVVGQKVLHVLPKFGFGTWAVFAHKTTYCLGLISQH